MPIEAFVNSNPDAFLFQESDAESGLRGPLTERPLRRRAVKADYAGRVAELLAKCAKRAVAETGNRRDNARTRR